MKNKLRKFIYRKLISYCKWRRKRFRASKLNNLEKWQECKDLGYYDGARWFMSRAADDNIKITYCDNKIKQLKYLISKI